MRVLHGTIGSLLAKLDQICWGWDCTPFGSWPRWCLCGRVRLQWENEHASAKRIKLTSAKTDHESRSKGAWSKVERQQGECREWNCAKCFWRNLKFGTTSKALSCNSNNNNTNGKTVEALHLCILPSVKGWMHVFGCHVILQNDDMHQLNQDNRWQKNGLIAASKCHDRCGGNVEGKESTPCNDQWDNVGDACMNASVVVLAMMWCVRTEPPIVNKVPASASAWRQQWHLPARWTSLATPFAFVSILTWCSGLSTNLSSNLSSSPSRKALRCRVKAWSTLRHFGKWSQITQVDVIFQHRNRCCKEHGENDNPITKAAELDGSARIWLCTPQQTSTETLTFLAQNQQLSNAMPMAKQQTPPLEQQIFIQLVQSSTNPIQKQQMASCNNDDKFKSRRNRSRCGVKQKTLQQGHSWWSNCPENWQQFLKQFC